MREKSELAIIRWSEHYPILAVLLVMFIFSHVAIAWQFHYHVSHLDGHITGLELRLNAIEIALTYAGQQRQHP